MRKLLIISLFTLAACPLESEDRAPAWDRQRAVIGPIELKDRVAYVDTARDRAVIVDASAPRPAVRTARVGRNAVFAAPTPDRGMLAVLTRGEEAVLDGQIDQEPRLYLVDPTSTAAPLEYEIGSPFDRLAIAEDGSVAVAYFSSGGFDADTGVFRNPNELAIVDLRAPPGDDNPTLRTVRSFGAAPDGVVLSPPMAVMGAPDETAGPRVFAYVLAPNTLTVLDTANPGSREVSVRLDTAGALVRPREIAFAPATGTAYVRSDNARDVLALLMTWEEPTSDTDNDFQLAAAELGAGAGPADVAVYDDLSGRRFVLAAMPGTRQVAVIDGDTAAFVTVPTPDAVDRVLLFPSGPNAVPRVAVLAALGQRVPRVHMLSLEGIHDELVPVDLRTIALEEPVLDIVAVPGAESAMIVHDDARTVLGLLDVRIGSVAPLLGVGRLDTYDFDDQGRFLVGATRDAARVGFLELGNLHPSDLPLDGPPARVFALTGGAVYVDHGDPYGRATIVPEPGARRDESTVVSGFLLAGYLDEDF